MWRKRNHRRISDTSVFLVFLNCWCECKLLQALWGTLWRFPKILGLKLPQDPTIPLLGRHPEKTITEKDMGIPIFIATLLTIARTWKQPRCPSTEEWIKKCYIYTIENYSAIKGMHLSLILYISTYIGEGDGTPLQYS